MMEESQEPELFDMEVICENNQEQNDDGQSSDKVLSSSSQSPNKNVKRIIYIEEDSSDVDTSDSDCDRVAGPRQKSTTQKITIENIGQKKVFLKRRLDFPSHGPANEVINVKYSNVSSELDSNLVELNKLLNDVTMQPAERDLTCCDNVGEINNEQPPLSSQQTIVVSESIKVSRNIQIPEPPEAVNENTSCSELIGPEMSSYYPSAFKLGLVQFAEMHGIEAASSLFKISNKVLELWSQSEKQIKEQFRTDNFSDWEQELFLEIIIALSKRQLITLKTVIDKRKASQAESLNTNDSSMIHWAVDWCKQFQFQLDEIQKNSEATELRLPGYPKITPDIETYGSSFEKSRYPPSFKLEVLKYSDSKSVEEASRKYNIRSSTIQRWISQHEVVGKPLVKFSKKSKKDAASKSTKHKQENLENQLVEWYRSMKDKGKATRQSLVISKARSLARKLNLSDFEPTSNWFENWIKKYLKTDKDSCGQSADGSEGHEPENPQSFKDEWKKLFDSFEASATSFEEQLKSDLSKQTETAVGMSDLSSTSNSVKSSETLSNGVHRLDGSNKSYSSEKKTSSSSNSDEDAGPILHVSLLSKKQKLTQPTSVSMKSTDLGSPVKNNDLPINSTIEDETKKDCSYTDIECPRSNLAKCASSSLSDMNNTKINTIDKTSKDNTNILDKVSPITEHIIDSSMYSQEQSEDLSVKVSRKDIVRYATENGMPAASRTFGVTEEIIRHWCWTEKCDTKQSKETSSESTSSETNTPSSSSSKSAEQLTGSFQQIFLKFARDDRNANGYEIPSNNLPGLNNNLKESNRFSADDPSALLEPHKDKDSNCEKSSLQSKKKVEKNIISNYGLRTKAAAISKKITKTHSVIKNKATSSETQTVPSHVLSHRLGYSSPVGSQNNSNRYSNKLPRRKHLQTHPSLRKLTGRWKKKEKNKLLPSERLDLSVTPPQPKAEESVAKDILPTYPTCFQARVIDCAEIKGLDATSQEFGLSKLLLNDWIHSKTSIKMLSQVENVKEWELDLYVSVHKSCLKGLNISLSDVVAKGKNILASLNLSDLYQFEMEQASDWCERLGVTTADDPSSEPNRKKEPSSETVHHRQTHSNDFISEVCEYTKNNSSIKAHKKFGVPISTIRSWIIKGMPKKNRSSKCSLRNIAHGKKVRGNKQVSDHSSSTERFEKKSSSLIANSSEIQNRLKPESNINNPVLSKVLSKVNSHVETRLSGDSVIVKRRVGRPKLTTLTKRSVGRPRKINNSYFVLKKKLFGRPVRRKHLDSLEKYEEKSCNTHSRSTNENVPENTENVHTSVDPTEVTSQKQSADVKLNKGISNERIELPKLNLKSNSKASCFTKSEVTKRKNYFKFRKNPGNSKFSDDFRRQVLHYVKLEGIPKASIHFNLSESSIRCWGGSKGVRPEKFSPEIKSKALACAQEFGVAQASHMLNVGVSTLSSWIVQKRMSDCGAEMLHKSNEISNNGEEKRNHVDKNLLHQSLSVEKDPKRINRRSLSRNLKVKYDNFDDYNTKATNLQGSSPTANESKNSISVRKRPKNDLIANKSDALEEDSLSCTILPKINISSCSTKEQIPSSRTYSPEFIKKVFEYVDKTSAQCAAEHFGLAASTLYKWLGKRNPVLPKPMKDIKNLEEEVFIWYQQVKSNENFIRASKVITKAKALALKMSLLEINLDQDWYKEWSQKYLDTGTAFPALEDSVLPNMIQQSNLNTSNIEGGVNDYVQSNLAHDTPTVKRNLNRQSKDKKLNLKETKLKDNDVIENDPKGNPPASKENEGSSPRTSKRPRTSVSFTHIFESATTKDNISERKKSSPKASKHLSRITTVYSPIFIKEVVEYVDKTSLKCAAIHFSIPKTTIYNWMMKKKQNLPKKTENIKTLEKEVFDWYQLVKINENFIRASKVISKAKTLALKMGLLDFDFDKNWYAYWSLKYLGVCSSATDFQDTPKKSSGSPNPKIKKPKLERKKSYFHKTAVKRPEPEKLMTSNLKTYSKHCAFNKKEADEPVLCKSMNCHSDNYSINDAPANSPKLISLSSRTTSNSGHLEIGSCKMLINNIENEESRLDATCKQVIEEVMTNIIEKVSSPLCQNDSSGSSQTPKSTNEVNLQTSESTIDSSASTFLDTDIKSSDGKSSLSILKGKKESSFEFVSESSLSSDAFSEGKAECSTASLTSFRGIRSCKSIFRSCSKIKSDHLATPIQDNEPQPKVHSHKKDPPVATVLVITDPGTIFQNWLVQVNANLEVLKPSDVLEKLTDIFKRTHEDFIDNWLFRLYYQQMKLIEHSMTNFENVISSLELEGYVAAEVKLEMISYMERRGFHETSSCFLIPIKRLNEWREYEYFLRKVLRIADLFRINSKHTHADLDIYEWYIQSQDQKKSFDEDSLKTMALKVYREHNKNLKRCYKSFLERFLRIICYDTMENAIFGKILEKFDCNVNLSKEELIEYYKTFLDEYKVKTMFSTSELWYEQFCERYSNFLIQRPKVTDILPDELSINVNIFRESLLKMQAQSDLNCIGSMDEIPFSFDSSINKNLEYIFQNCSLKNFDGVVLLSCLSSGKVLPPFVIFKVASKKQKLLPPENDINESVICQWLQRVWIPNTPQGRSILILDSFEPHTMPKFTALAESLNVSLAIVPAGCCSKVHPVAAGLRHRFETLFHILREKRHPGKNIVLDKPQVISLVNEVHARLSKERNLVKQCFELTSVLLTQKSISCIEIS